MPCGWEGNRRYGIALAMRQTLVVLHLRAQGLGEGDEHPSTLSCGAWLTLPFTYAIEPENFETCNNVFEFSCSQAHRT